MIWLNSDNEAAIKQAEKEQRITYNRQIVNSDRKLAALLFRLQEIEDELDRRSEEDGTDTR